MVHIDLNQTVCSMGFSVSIHNNSKQKWVIMTFFFKVSLTEFQSVTTASLRLNTFIRSKTLQFWQILIVLLVLENYRLSNILNTNWQLSRYCLGCAVATSSIYNRQFYDRLTFVISILFDEFQYRYMGLIEMNLKGYSNITWGVFHRLGRWYLKRKIPEFPYPICR